MLYAGTTSLQSFKYSILNYTVKKLKQWSKSAGNILKIKIRTSETLRNGIVVDSENVKHVSNYVPKHSRPENDEQLGHYLAGLIDGDGHFSKAQQLIIVFSCSDAFLAYYLKQRLGYCQVRKIKNKNAYILIMSKKQAIVKVINLITYKLRNQHRFDQVVNNILNHKTYQNLNIDFGLNLSNNLNNYWLAGFSDADASFQIKIINRTNRDKPEIRLNYQVDQKKKELLILIKTCMGGNIGYRKTQDTYYYGSTNFGSAKNIVEYFDKFNLQSRKHVSYLRWRKVYRLIQDKEHLTEKGLLKIIKLKALINKHENSTTIQDKVLTKT